MIEMLINKLVDLSMKYGELQYRLRIFTGELDENGKDRYAELLAEKDKIYYKIEVLKEVFNDKK